MRLAKTFVLIILLIAGFSAGCVEEDTQLASAEELFKTSRYDEAIVSFDKIIENDPGNIDALNGILQWLPVAISSMELTSEVTSGQSRMAQAGVRCMIQLEMAFVRSMR